ncbi:hypothetical protein TWF718_005826 [Orbilia javanica]|uniref:Uncharacterized protein n=1 Tax=Orbilia javanica TaxID=47235 RepID=A0AAN8N1M7_9PEZI
MAIKEDAPGTTPPPKTLLQNKIPNSNHPIPAILKINPKTKKPTLYYMTICAPRHKIGFCMDLIDSPIMPSPDPSSPLSLLETPPLDPLNPALNTTNHKSGDDDKLDSKDTATNMAILLNFFNQNIHQPFTDYPNAQVVYDKLVGSLDKNCLSDDDLAIVKALAEEENPNNRGLIAEKVKGYMVNIFLENSFPQEVANSAAELIMPQVVDIFFEEGHSI